MQLINKIKYQCLIFKLQKASFPAAFGKKKRQSLHLNGTNTLQLRLHTHQHNMTDYIDAITNYSIVIDNVSFLISVGLLFCVVCVCVRACYVW